METLGLRGNVGLGSKQSVPAAVRLGFCLAAIVLGGIPSQAAPPGGGLEGLRGRVTSGYTGKTLPAVLTDLGKREGVTLTCDSAFTRRRLILHIRERPLNEVLDHIATFLREGDGRPYWKRSSAGGRATYRLKEDPVTRRARLARVDRRDLTFRSRFRLAQQAAAMGEAELERLRTRAPELAHKPPSWSMPIINQLPAGSLELAIRKGRLSIPYSELPGALQSILRQSLARVRFVVGDKEDGEVVLRYDGSRDFATAKLQISLWGSPLRPDLAVHIVPNKYQRTGSTSVLYPSLPPEKSRPDWMKSVLKRREAADNKERTQDTPVLRHASMEHLVTIREWTPVKVTDGSISRRSLGLPAALEQLAEQIEMPLIADYDPVPWDYYAPGLRRTLNRDLAKMPVREVLDTFAAAWSTQSSIHKDWLHIRSDAGRLSAWDGLKLP